MDFQKYWDAVIGQDAQSMTTFFWEDAQIRWHNTNECFSVSEFIRANCEYPGQWHGEIEHIVNNGSLVITVTHIYNHEETVSHHAVTFFTLKEGKIAGIDEYWGEDGLPPRWRQEMNIGSTIRQG